MPFGRPARHREARVLGISLLIFSLVHTPLPQPDFHNIRHHDGPGEVCDHHDHLLRWHPGAGSAEDVAILHWHWFLPNSGRSDEAPTGTGPSVHAHVCDGIDLAWVDGPRILPDHSSRLLGRLKAGTPPAFSLAILSDWVSTVPDQGPRPRFAFCATAAPRPPLTSLLQRWSC